jgi:hypothetical protein
MGYPSVGIEKLYRNSLTDVKNYFAMYYREVKVKIY